MCVSLFSSLSLSLSLYFCWSHHIFSWSHQFCKVGVSSGRPEGFESNTGGQNSEWVTRVSLEQLGQRKKQVNWNMHFPANVRCWSKPGREILISSVCLMNRGLCVRVHKLSKQHAQSAHIWILRKNKAKQLWKLNYHRQRQDESFNDSNHGLNCA